ncbi:hypothetical protein MJO29_012555 [Puccinia striiformis f. sp. tritici]|uniref:Uncharacterized protein n=1 Tax=Puccinia striiformis TaxID=27350 RepID=A0A2S4V7T3_9BASI|nr:hypothetical protein Pst134EB_024030 [Puccinia striiformis f. sp. tritici]KAI7946167.1 hypothetical protein MJO29_012555 [Puccinia striiformis f. sp. tritici]KAI9631066.1 hypothetical protein KEM48_013323 [Puccinia striiformis f. sp. tritici PST-130]POW05581.1 hypothetical protein PSHT_10715 [Puccinia striiformis]
MTDRINAGDLDGIEAVREQVKQAGALVVNRFEDLIYKYEPDRDDDRPPEHMSDRPNPEGMVSDNLKKDLLKHLQLRFFPLLERQIGYLVRLLEPTNLLGEPLQTLERITAIQHELDRTLEQIQTSAFSICPEQIDPDKDSPEYEVGDQHREELKQFRLRGMYMAIRGALDEVGSFSISQWSVFNSLTCQKGGKGEGLELGTI